MSTTIKVLIVDDEPDIIEFLSYNFCHNGYEVKSACNGQKALEMLSSFVPDIIISDILMPELNGIEFCRSIKSNDLFKNIPVIFLSAANDEYLALSSIAVGGAKYLSKPVRVPLLLNIMQATLRKAS